MAQTESEQVDGYCANCNCIRIIIYRNRFAFCMICNSGRIMPLSRLPETIVETLKRKEGK